MSGFVRYFPENATTSERNVAETNFTAESVYNSEKNVKPFMLYFVTKTHKTLLLFKMPF